MKIADKIKLKIRGQLLLYILGSFFVIYCCTIGYLNYRNSDQHIRAAKSMAISISAQHANLIKGELDKIFQVTRDLAEIGKVSAKTDWKTFNDMYMQAQKNILLENEGFLGVATSWEYAYLDKNYDKNYGRYLSGYYYGDGIAEKIEMQRNMTGDDIAGNYYRIKSTKKEMLVDPSYYSYSGREEDMVMNANFNTPIIINNEYVGLAGIDVDLGYFQNITDTTKPFRNSYSFILSNNGTWVTSHHRDFIGKKISETNEDFCERNNIIEKVQNGEYFTLIFENTYGHKMFYTFSPVISMGDSRPWSFAIAVPLEVVTEIPNRINRYSIIISIIGLIIVVAVILLVSKTISKPIIRTTRLIQELAKGNIFYNYEERERRYDEIGEMEQSLEQLSKGLVNAVSFAKELGDGNLNATILKLSDQDVLTQTLIDTQDSLRRSAEELAAKHDEERSQRWISETISKLEGIIRKTSESVKELGYNVLDFILKQTGASQGALYILNDDDPKNIYYEMVSALAYDRKRLMHYKVHIGEGLVGRCAHEKLTIYMTDIPENYVHISSGLGEANPTCLILLPVIENDNVLGVLEILSFKTFDKYQVIFLEKASASIAATINSAKVNQRTEELLQQTQKQAEILSQQEEEMRQNIEEMNATIEETAKAQYEMKGFIEAINKVSMIITYDMSRVCIDVNDTFLNKFDLRREQIIGRKQGFFASKEQDPKSFDKLWNNLEQGQVYQITQEVDIHGNRMSVVEIYVPVFNASGNPYKVYNICIDVTKS